MFSQPEFSQGRLTGMHATARSLSSSTGRRGFCQEIAALTASTVIGGVTAPAGPVVSVGAAAAASGTIPIWRLVARLLGIALWEDEVA